MACTSYSNYRVKDKVGVGNDGIKLDKDDQFLIMMRNDETPQQAVSRYHDKIVAAMAAPEWGGRARGQKSKTTACAFFHVFSVSALNLPSL